MHQREIFEPDDMVFRNNLGSIVAGSLVTVGNQRLAPTVVNPPIRVQWLPKRLDHHVFVVALEADQRDPHFLGRHQMIDDLAALRATVDVSPSVMILKDHSAACLTIASNAAVSK